MTYYPIIIPTLNRYSHFANCIKSLLLCTHSTKTDVIIGLDFPLNENHYAGYNEIKNFIPTIQGFKSIHVIYRKKNYGAIKNTEDLIQYVLDRFEGFIFTEDDNVFSPNFLDYMNYYLNFHKENTYISAICGHSLYPRELLKTYISMNNIIESKGRFCAWGYGTWKDRWTEFSNNIIFPMQPIICNNRKSLIKLSSSLEHLNFVFNWLNNDKLNYICDFTIALYMMLHDKKAVFPLISLVKNNGYDGSGVNCACDDNYILKDMKISDSELFTFDKEYDEIEIKRYLKSYKKQSLINNINFKERLYIRFELIIYLIFKHKYGKIIITNHKKLLKTVNRIKKRIRKSLKRILCKKQ